MELQMRAQHTMIEQTQRDIRALDRWNRHFERKQDHMAAILELVAARVGVPPADMPIEPGRDDPGPEYFDTDAEESDEGEASADEEEDQ